VDLALEGKCAIVTGGSEGLGRATVLALAAEGCDVAFCARRSDPLEEVAAEVRGAHGRRAVPVVADLRHLDEVDRFVSEAAAAFGRIDIVVNCAGASQFGTLFNIPDERWSEDITLKLIGYVRVARAAVPHMRGRSGHIVNVAGAGGKIPSSAHLTGGAANAAVLNFTHALAQQLGEEGINVVAISPGHIRSPRFTVAVETRARESGQSHEEVERALTDAIPIRRAATLAEIAQVIAFFASDRASCVTGSSVAVDGGLNPTI